ncbi:MAG: efflux RND transporter periplasmic adaptor subunit [Vicingaceae bacterium]
MKNNFYMKAIQYIVASTFIMVAVGCGSSDKKSGDQKTEDVANTHHKVKVNILTLKPEKFEHYFEVNGTVKSDYDVLLSPEMNGQIKKIYVKEGEKVAQGQLLAKLNTSVIENNINEVKTSLALADLVFKKQEKLWLEQKIGSEIQYLEAKTKKESLEDRLKALQSQLQMSELKAPFPGVVDALFKKEGEVISPGMPLLELVNLKELYVDADVSETYLPKIKLHDSVYVKFPALGDNFMVKATIERIGNVINTGNRTFATKVSLSKNTPEIVKPNLMAYVGIRDYKNDTAMVIPSQIILQDNNGYFVYKVNNNKAEKAYLQPLFASGDKTAVASKELKFGDKVITDGYNQVSQGVEVTIK